MTWEDRWDQNQPGAADPGDICNLPIAEDELPTATLLWSQARYLALNREKGDGRDYITREPDDNLVEDKRRIDPAHSVAWFTMSHHGNYWEVYAGSNEFSSSYRATGRGATLQEAIDDMFLHS
jgi:hypothetical protein